MHDAKQFFENDGHSCFESLRPFIVEYAEDSCAFGKTLWLRVHENATLVATAEFMATGSALAWAQNVFVAPAFRRRRIASALYRLAENVYRRALSNMWKQKDEGQTDDAKKLWANPDRPFGFPRAFHGGGNPARRILGS